MKVRYKPIVMEATQFRTADPITHQHVNFGEPSSDPGSASYLTGRHWVQTQVGPAIVSDGDWIITGADGEKSLCKAADFAKAYEPANLAPPGKKNPAGGIIPLDMCQELKILGQGKTVGLKVLGILTDKGVLVENVSLLG